MRNVGSLIEPILLHLAADKAKERHDAVTRLKAILDTSSSSSPSAEMNIPCELATRLVQTFVKMIRIELKAFLVPKEEYNITESKSMTSIQLNKINQLMKDTKWLLALLDRFFPKTNILLALPDLYNLVLDCLESGLAIVYCDILLIVRSFILARKVYLLEIRTEQWDRFIDAFGGFSFPENMQSPPLSVALEDEIISSVFFLTLAIPEDVWTWSGKIMAVGELVVSLLNSTLERGSESPSLCVLFRTANYILQELRFRDPLCYEGLLVQIKPLIMSFPVLKMASTTEELFLFFLQNEVEPSMQLEVFAAAEMSRSRLRPSELDPVRLAQSMAEYLRRNRSFTFSKGYLPYILGIDFCSRYHNRAPEPLEYLLKASNSSQEKLALHLFEVFSSKEASLRELMSLFESGTGLHRSWITAMTLGKLYVADFEKDQIPKLFKLCANDLLKRSSTEHCCTILYELLQIDPTLVHSSNIAFSLYLEALAPTVTSKPCLIFLKSLYGLSFRGLWWSHDALEAYQSICTVTISAFETASDARFLLDPIISNASEIADLFAIPFSRIEKAILSESFFLPETECLKLLARSKVSITIHRTVDFEVQIEPKLACLYERIYSKFRSDLLEQIQIVGFQPCKVLLQNAFQMNPKEDNFDKALIQLIDVHKVIKSGSCFDVSLTAPLPFLLSPYDLDNLYRSITWTPEVDLTKAVSLLKLLIQCYEFFKFKKSSKHEFANSSNHMNFHLSIRPYAFLDHLTDRNQHIPFNFMKLFCWFAQFIRSYTMDGVSEDIRLFVDDFFLYLKAEFATCLSSSSMYLALIEGFSLCLTDPLPDVGSILGSNIYRRDDTSVLAMVKVILLAMKSSKNVASVKKFSKPILGSYFKWCFRPERMGVFLKLVVELGRLEFITSGDLWKALLNPAPYSFDMYSSFYADILELLDKSELKRLIETDPSFWTSAGCIAETLTKLKAMLLSVKRGYVDFHRSLESLVFSLPSAQMFEFTSDGQPRLLLQAVLDKDLHYRIGEYLLAQWIDRGLKIDAFPYLLFGDNLSDLMANAKVFTAFILALGSAEAVEMYKPNAGYLQENFSHIVAFALYQYFAGKHTDTEFILSKILKPALGDGGFEAIFRENVLEIVFAIMELSIAKKNSSVIDSALGHIGSMFKCENVDEILSPAYAVHIVLLALENILINPSVSFGVIELMLQRTPSLFEESAVVHKILSGMQGSFVLTKLPPSPSLLNVLNCLSSRINGSQALRKDFVALLAKLVSFPYTLRIWLEYLTFSNSALCAVFDLCRALTSMHKKSAYHDKTSELDGLLVCFLENGSDELKAKALNLIYDQDILLPATAKYAKHLLDNGMTLDGEHASEIKIFVSSLPVVTSEQALVPTPEDSLEEAITSLSHVLAMSAPRDSRPIFTAIAQILNTDGICRPGFIASLPEQLKAGIEFLKLDQNRRRLLFPKYRCPEGLQSYGDLWSATSQREGSWCSSLIQVLVSTFAKNPLWIKIGYVFVNEMAASQLLPIVFEDCFFADSVIQDTLLAPIRRFLLCYNPESSTNKKMLASLVSIVERLLARRKPGVAIDLDLRRLGSLLSDEPLRALYFFEMGLDQFFKISDSDSNKLEELYKSLGAAEYSGCFSAQARLNLISSALDVHLNGSALDKIRDEQDRVLWDLQKWDFNRVPDNVKLDQNQIDTYNLLCCISNDRPELLKVQIENVATRLPSLSKDLLQATKVGVAYLNQNKIVPDAQSPGPIDLCLLGIRPQHKSELLDAGIKILTKARTDDDMRLTRRCIRQLENLKIAGLDMILMGEKSKLLWMKGSVDEAVGLMKMAVQALPERPIGDVVLREYAASSHCLLGEWIFQLKSENASSIKESYLDEALRIIGKAPSNPETLAYVYSTYAKFVDHLFDQMNKAENLETREKLLKKTKQDLEALSKLTVSSGRNESLLRSISDLEKQYRADKQEFDQIERTRTSFLLLAVENYLRCFQLVDKHDFSVFRVCSLWLQYYASVPEISQLIASSIGKVPCHKFLPLIYQLAARAELSEVRSNEGLAFQETLERLLFRMAVKHPYHCIYQILALKSGTVGAKAAPSKRKLVYSTESLEVRRAAAASALIAKLKSGGDSRLAKIVESIEMLCASYIELANVELPPDTKANVSIKFDSRWSIGRLTGPDKFKHPVALPTKTIPVDASGQYADVTTICGFSPGFRVVGGINLPKIIECLGSDGRVYRQLVKGKDDVRQDAVMEQVFSLVDLMLKSNEATRSKGLGIRTYRIISLHALAGLLEWVSDTVPLGEYVLPAHDRYNPGDLTVKAARNQMKAIWEEPGSTPAAKQRVYQEISSRFRPVLRHFFWETASCPSDWWSRRLRYVASCAAASMLGHVVGLGDRHCQNILLDKKSGDLIQIDLNMIFELGKTLRVPERVPFRLTRDIVDGMGPAGTRGGFIHGAECTLKLLRREAETILMILEVFKHDPLYRWSLNPLKQARMTANFANSIRESSSASDGDARKESCPPEADRALLRVREKLLGFEEGGVQLSEAGQVRFLVQEATSVERLSHILKIMYKPGRGSPSTIMSKEAVVFLLDVGCHLWKEKNSGASPLDKAIKCLSMMLGQKIMDARKTDQVALLLANSPETDNKLYDPDAGSDEYQHISVARPFDSAKYELIRFLQEALPLGDEESSVANPVDAIVVAVDLLIELTQGKAYGQRRVIYFSDFSGRPFEAGENELEHLGQVKERLQSSGVTVDLIDLCQVGAEGSTLKNFLEPFVEELEGCTYEIDEALGMLSEFAAKRSRQVATFRGTLDVGQELKLPVSIYARTAPAKIPSAHKMVGGGASAERDLSYRLVQDQEDDDSQQGAILQKEQLIKAYRYGRSLIPFGKIDEAALGYGRAEKVLTVLGFVPSQSIDRPAFMSSLWTVLPERDNQAASTAMAALVQACFERDVAALARYVRAVGGSPRLVALLPALSADEPAAFTMVALPFAEDLRRFTFPSLEKLPKALQPSDEQRELMRTWIHSMRLPEEDELPRNPSNQRLVQSILARLQDPIGPIPPVEPRIIEPFAGPPADLALNALPALEALRSAFELRPRRARAEITRFWSTGEEEATASEPLCGKDSDAAPEPSPRQISAERPVEDFEAMVSDRHTDLVLSAFTQLMALIPRLALQPATLPLAIESLMAMRRAAIREDEQDLFNAYLQELKKAAFSDDDPSSPAVILWQCLCKHSQQDLVTLISSDEHPSSLLLPQHAQTFFSDTNQPTA